MADHAGGPNGTGGGRRQARERALSLLYEAESKDVPPAAVLAALPVEPAPFAVDVVTGVGEHLEELDKWIASYAKDWTIDRMPALDRALLRMGVFELLHRPDVPTGAVISEAVELAQRFSTDESSRFVNGMLARIAESVRSNGEAVDPEAVAPDPAEDHHPTPGQMVEDGLDEEG
jgi:N utilization substance protein B